MKFKLIFLVGLSALVGYVARDTATVPEQAQASPAAEPGAEYSAPASIEWLSEAEAKASGKTVLYLATLTKGCVPCNKLKALLNNPASVEAMNRFSCVLIEDPPANHPWVRHYEKVTAGRFAFPAMVFVGPKRTTPQVQVGAPDSVAALLQFLDQMESRFAGKSSPIIIPDSTKTSITYPPKPTLAPASHNTVAPTHPKGRLVAGTQERSCVTCRRKSPHLNHKPPIFHGLGPRAWQSRRYR